MNVEGEMAAQALHDDQMAWIRRAKRAEAEVARLARVERAARGVAQGIEVVVDSHGRSLGARTTEDFHSRLAALRAALAEAAPSPVDHA